MKLYLTRHGLTDWNVQHKAQGRTDIPLNDIGKQQAGQLRDRIKDVRFDAVYASPLKRAAETAQIAIDGRNEIIYDDRLIERSFGDFEGKEINGWAESTGFDIGDLKLNTNVGNIEPVKDVLARVKEFLDDLKAKHGNDETILIVAHGQVVRGFHHNLVGYDDNSDWWSVKFSNAETRKYEV